MSFLKYKKSVVEDPRSEKLDFTPDGRNHYVYRVTKDREHYYGSRTDLNEDTIGVTYFTSSCNKNFAKDFKANPKNYKVKIIKSFNNPGDKILFESYLHQKFDVKNHDNFINRANQTAFGFDTTGVFIKEKHPMARKIYQLDKDNGEIIKKWSCIAEAEKNLNITNINNCLGKRQLTAGGFVWCYAEEHTISFVEEICLRNYNKTGANHINSRPVYKLDKNTGEILEEFSSITEAQKYIKHGNVNMCCLGTCLTAGGFVWCFVENYTSELKIKIIEKKYKNCTERPVYKLDKNTGEILEEFSNKRLAQESVVKGCVEAVLRGRCNTAGSYGWSFVDEYILKVKNEG